MKQLKQKHVNDDGLNEKIESTNATCKNEHWYTEHRVTRAYVMCFSNMNRPRSHDEFSTI
jgi:hypothetical protein